MALRTIIFGALGAMILAHGWTASGHLAALWQAKTGADALLRDIRTVRHLVDGAQALAYERGLTASVIKGLDPVEGDLAGRRAATDRAFAAELAALSATDATAMMLRDLIADLRLMRELVDASLARGEAADLALVRESWLTRVAGLIAGLEDAVFARSVPRHAEGLSLIQNWQIITQALRLRVAMGLDGSVLNTVVYDQRIMTPADIVTHERLLGRVQEVYDGLRRQAGDHPYLQSPLEAIEATYWQDFVPLRNRILENAWSGRAPAVSGDAFVAAVLPAVDAMVALIHTAIDVTEAEAISRDARIQRDLLTNGLLIVGYLILAILILATVQWRVIRPVKTMIDDLDATLADDTSGPVSAASRDEVGRLHQAVQGFLSGRAALRASEQRFKMAVEAASDGIWDWNLVTNEIWYSPQWKAQLGYADHELENTFDTWLTLIFPEDGAEAVRMVDDYNAGRIPTFEAVQRFRHKNGQTVLIHSRAVTERAADGTPLRMVGAHTDITARTRALDALADKERELSSILESVADGIITVNGDGRIRSANKAAEQIFAYASRDLSGRFVTSLVPDLPWGWIDGQTDSASRPRVPVAPEIGGLTGRRRDGSEFPLDLSLSETWIAGERVVTGVFRDATERVRHNRDMEASRRELEHRAAQLAALADKLDLARVEADRANQAKSRFLATMSHELRTPMTGVLGMADLLLASTLETNQRRWVQMLKHSAEALLTLVNDILDFSKIEAGQLTLETLDFDPRLIVAEVLQLLDSRAAEKGVALIQDGTEAMPAVVRGDPTRLRQILFNLVGNAIKFTTKGRIVTRFAAVRPCPDGDMLLRFEVEDTGIGITEDQMARLFQPFRQADESTTRRHGGTGLGLAICRSLTEAMGGEIGCTSQPGCGSTFWFTVQVAPGTLAPARQAEDHGPGLAVAPGRGLRILIAEDIDINRHLLTDVLTMQGHAVVAVANGVQAVEAATSASFDVVLMDMQMPEMDGVGAARLIRAAEAQPGRLPIIALTADVLAERTLETDPAAISAVLTKPVDWARLDAVMRRLTGGATDPAARAVDRDEDGS